MKSFVAFSNTFSDKILSLNNIYTLAQQQESLNGLYLCTNNSINSSYINIDRNTVKTWYDLSGSTNYLYSTDIDSAPSFLPIDNNLNQQASIEFNQDGTERLSFNTPLTVKTVIIVYYSKEDKTYLLYSPLNTIPPDPLYYDTFPSFSNTIWSTCSLSNNFAYNSTTRLNTQVKPSNTQLPFNYPRILSVHNLGGNEQSAVISGIGGRIGKPNGGDKVSGVVDSVKGNIAAILTFSENLDSATLLELELSLREVYINYTGSTVVGTKVFKYLVNDTVNFDFSTIVVDGWAIPVTYELLFPFNLGLNFTGSVLQGFLSSVYDDIITIRITNSIGLQTTLDFKFEVVKPDPLVSLLPEPNNLKLVLSSHKDTTTSTTYGVYVNSDNTISKWEDARRVGSGLLTLVPNGTGIGNYIKTETLPKVALSVGQRLTLPSNINLKSFLLVYVQTSYGNRYLLDGLPDRRGTGVLLTTNSNSQIHGQTDVTRLVTYVNKVKVNTLLYKYGLNTLGFIYGYQQDNINIPIYGLDSLRGSLYFAAIWDKQLTVEQLNQSIAAIADRYVTSQAPFIVNSNTEFRKVADIEIDLSTKIVDLKNRALTYNIVSNHYSASITNNTLSFVGTQDEVLTFVVDVTNTDNYTTTLTFKVDITLRTNSLYLNIKEYFNTLSNSLAITDIYLATSDSLVLSSGNIVNEWKDYRLNGKTSSCVSITTTTSEILNSQLGISFPLNGTGYVEFGTNIVSSNFVLVYVKPNTLLGLFNFLGNTTSVTWATDTELVDTDIASPSISFGTKYVNKREVSNTYRLQPNILNIIYINTASPVTVQSLARQLTTNNLSIKGIVPLFLTLSDVLTLNESKILDGVIRDYYDPVRFVLILHFNNNLIDSSVQSSNLIATANFTTVSKFNSHALRLLHSSGLSLIQVPNSNNISFLSEYFSISFWLNISNPLATSTVLTLYAQDNLAIYLKGNAIYVARSVDNIDILISYVLPSILYSTQGTYFHVELSRVVNGQLLLFINGTQIGVVIDNIEYTNTIDNAIIGGIQGMNSTNCSVNMDEFVILKRGFLHDNNFVVASSEYIV